MDYSSVPRTFRNLLVMLEMLDVSNFRGFRRNLSWLTSLSDWDDHPFWNCNNSRIRFIASGSYRWKVATSHIAELTLLHGNSHFYARLYNAAGMELCYGDCFSRQDCEALLKRFIEVTRGDFVVAFKSIEVPLYQAELDCFNAEAEPRMLDLSPVIDEAYASEKQDAVLDLDRRSSLEFAYMLHTEEMYSDYD